MTIKEKISDLYNAEMLSGLDFDKLLTELPLHLQTILHKADQERTSLPDYQRTVSLPGYRIDSLGMYRDKNEKSVHDVGAFALAAFASAGKPFSIGIRGNQNGTVSFTIGSKSSIRQIRRFLRAAYGSAAVSETKEQEYDLFYYGRCEQVFLNQDLIEKNDPETVGIDWLEALAKSAAGLVFDASMIFIPLEEEWLVRQMNVISGLIDDLSSFEKSSLQLSRSFGNAPIVIQSLPGNVKNAITGTTQSNLSKNDSTSIELTRTHSVIGIYMEELKYRLRQLKQLQRDGGWSVVLQIRAKKSGDASLVRSIYGGALGKSGYRCTWDTEPCCGFAVPVQNLSQLAELPQQSYPGFILENIHQFEVNPPVLEQSERAVDLGNLIWNHQELDCPFQIPLTSLNRHAFVCGMTGSGKSNTVCGILSQLKRDHNIPFLVIEPVKGEYRSLKKEFEDIEVYDLRAGSQNQLFFNPFWFPEGGRLQYHIDSLRAIFTSALGLYAAMPNILEQCMISCYIKKGWKIASDRNIYENRLPKHQLYPTFSQLCQEIENYLERSDFKGESKGNYKGALLTRLQSFTFGTKGMLFNQPVEPDYQRWIKEGSCCVIELEALSDDADKAIVMGTLLSQYFQSLKCVVAVGQTNLRHTLVLEEAHHLLSENTGSGVEGGMNSRQQLVEMLSNVLAEIRSYGEGVMIVDQSPTSVSSQVIKNTAIKIVHRVDYGDDLDVLQHALLLKSEDADAPAALDQGYALVRYGSMKLPSSVHIPRCETKENADYELAGTEVSEDKGNLYWMIQTNDYAKERLKIYVGKFVNDLLFDGVEQIKMSFNKLCAGIWELLEQIGCSDSIVESELTKNAFYHIVTDVFPVYLDQSFTDQTLLSGQIQMIAERYLKILLDHEIKSLEYDMFQAYCQEEIYPALERYYQNQGGNVRFFAESGTHRYLAGILDQMVGEYERLSLEERHTGIPSDAGAMVLLQNSFLVVPEVLPEKRLIDVLWDKLQYYIDSETSSEIDLERK